MCSADSPPPSIDRRSESIAASINRWRSAFSSAGGSATPSPIAAAARAWTHARLYRSPASPARQFLHRPRRQSERFSGIGFPVLLEEESTEGVRRLIEGLRRNAGTEGLSRVIRCQWPMVLRNQRSDFLGPMQGVQGSGHVPVTRPQVSAAQHVLRGLREHRLVVLDGAEVHGQGVERVSPASPGARAEIVQGRTQLEPDRRESSGKSRTSPSRSASAF